MVYSDYELAHSTRTDKLRYENENLDQKYINAFGGNLTRFLFIGSLLGSTAYFYRKFTHFGKFQRLLAAASLGAMMSGFVFRVSVINFGNLSELQNITPERVAYYNVVEEKDMSKFVERKRINQQKAIDSLGQK